MSSVSVCGAASSTAFNIAPVVIPIVCALYHKSLVGLVLLIFEVPSFVIVVVTNVFNVFYFSVESILLGLVFLKVEAAGAQDALTFIAIFFIYFFYLFADRQSLSVATST